MRTCSTCRHREGTAHRAGVESAFDCRDIRAIPPEQRDFGGKDPKQSKKSEALDSVQSTVNGLGNLYTVRRLDTAWRPGPGRSAFLARFRHEG